MRLLALHGMAGAGKDTFADRLVDRHGFVKRGFADPLYEEVAAAFGLTVEWLRDRSRKEAPQYELRIQNCKDVNFVEFCNDVYHSLSRPRSPRWVLEQWGTDFRRVYQEQGRYWLDKMEAFCRAEAGVRATRGVVIPDCRFINEAAWVRDQGGHVARIIRPDAAAVSSHVSAIPLPGELVDSTVYNNAGISHVHGVADSSPYSGSATDEAVAA